MPSILNGLDEICDSWLGIDASWKGDREPRYKDKANLQRLCQYGWGGQSGPQLMNELYGKISKNWSSGPCTGRENWRFKKQLKLTDGNPSQEVSLERTIARITDDNWVNQVPIASGIDGTRGAHNIDLVHRSGAGFTFIELKVASNHPLFAAFEIVKYGMVYVFSRIHADKLGYQVKKLEMLRATGVQLQVLAPDPYYTTSSIDWFRSLEECLNTGLEKFARQEIEIPMGFSFSVFPNDFTWDSTRQKEIEARRNLLWALHNRRSLNER